MRFFQKVFVEKDQRKTCQVSQLAFHPTKTRICSTYSYNKGSVSKLPRKVSFFSSFYEAGKMLEKEKKTSFKNS